MHSNIRKSLCPSRFCSADDPAQTLVSQQQADAANEAAIAGAIICSACGCVWVKGPQDRAHALGTLRRYGRTYEWKTLYKLPGG